MKCQICNEPIYKFRYQFGGKEYETYKHERDRNKKVDVLKEHRAKPE